MKALSIGSTRRVVTPGFRPSRLVRLVREQIERCDLRLHGGIVLTEGAIGPYAVTPVMAAMAGADRVYAVTRSTRHGTVEQVIAQTRELAERAAVETKIEIITDKSAEIVRAADIITNSGHVRPIDRAMIESAKATCVIPLMYEAWEFRRADIDLDACRLMGIPVAGTNERHPAVDVFSYLGIMGVKLLLDAGVAVCGSRVLLLCDNPFAPYIERGLKGAGAHLVSASRLADVANDRYDAILVALRPGTVARLQAADAQRIAGMSDDAVVVQYWGDVDRQAFEAEGIPVWPQHEPAPGHMGVLPSAIGPEAIVRLQCGGLKVGELLSRSRRAGMDARAAVRAAVEAGFADSLE